MSLLKTNLGSTTQEGGKIPNITSSNYVIKVDLSNMKLCLRPTFHYNITGRSEHQVLFFQWQGLGPARTWRSAATARYICCHRHVHSVCPSVCLSQLVLKRLKTGSLKQRHATVWGTLVFWRQKFRWLSTPVHKASLQGGLGGHVHPTFSRGCF